ncbi:uncharacterized protein LOC144123960 [Amblyomma americanum]
MGSRGAATAAFDGRGSRIEDCEDKDYQIILPTLPTGRVIFNTAFLHGDVRARPFRVEDFRSALAETGTLPDLSLLPEVIALGAYRMNHVWAVTFKDDETLKEIVSAGELKVKSARCLVIDPADQDVRMKLHWRLHSVPDEDVGLALAPFGKVTNVSRERWRVHGVSDKASTTRLVTIKLNAGVKLDDLPHQVSVAGELALVVVSSRPPLCLRCSGTGHVRRDCRIPRCGACRRIGHEEGQCARTYASVAGPVNSEDKSSLLMDEADAEDASKEASVPVAQASTSTVPQAELLVALPSNGATLGQQAGPTAQADVAPKDEAAAREESTVSDPSWC